LVLPGILDDDLVAALRRHSASETPEPLTRSLMMSAAW
jgi:hypothetical protein